MTIQLRGWQSDAVERGLKWYEEDRGPFLINAAPGTGKTICSIVIAMHLIRRKKIDRVIVIAPRKEVVRQWARDFKDITGRHMMRVTSVSDNEDSLTEHGVDVCATWAAIQNLSDAFQAMCRDKKTFIICDEHHHAAVEAAWGSSAESAFKDAAYSLVLTGTPIRSDGEETTWFAYDSKGRIDHPEQGTFSLSYGEAVDLLYCRPVSFHRHEGNFRVKLDDNEELRVSGQKGIENPESIRDIKAVQAALDYYLLACTPTYEKDGVTPNVRSYQGSMLQWGSSKLDNLRLRMPSAGGLVIAPNIEVADHMADLLEIIENERPTIVHTKTNNVEEKIEAFRNTSKRWIVSVGMVSEGVDIKRLRVLVYLPTARTELHFRQAIGRVVRSGGKEDDSRAYVIMPTHKLFEEYARRVEREMPAIHKSEGESKANEKVCGECGETNELNAETCSFCEKSFPVREEKFVACNACGGLNQISARDCQFCGADFRLNYTLELEEAFRMGAIIRGMELEESLVQESEDMSEQVRERILQDGDEVMLKFLRTFPEESFAKFKRIIDGD